VTRFKKTTTSKRAKQQDRQAISAMRAIIEKIETGQMSVEIFGSWTAREGKLNFKIVLIESDIPVLSEQLREIRGSFWQNICFYVMLHGTYISKQSSLKNGPCISITEKPVMYVSWR